MMATTRNSSGKIVYYTADDFYEEIIVQKKCFICGADRNSKVFNDEHVLPNWILTKYKLHNQSINLPNSRKYKYSKYKVPCCMECNLELGTYLENPISKLLKSHPIEIVETIGRDENNLQLLFDWCSTIFFKVMLKDLSFFWVLDQPEVNFKIGETYDWSEYHHIHCMIRKFFTGAIVDRRARGSIFILPTLVNKESEPFDLTVNAKGQSILLKLGELCIICIMNDSGAACNLFNNTINKIDGRLSQIQLREIFCHATYINIYLQNRPKHYSEFWHKNEEFHIRAEIPDYWYLFEKGSKETTIGELMTIYCSPLIGAVENKDEVLNAIKNSEYNFLFDLNGNFLNNDIDS